MGCLGMILRRTLLGWALAKVGRVFNRRKDRSIDPQRSV